MIAKYFEDAKRLVVYGPTWTLSGRVPTLAHLPGFLRLHGLAHRNVSSVRKWEKVGNIYYAELKRCAPH